MDTEINTGVLRQNSITLYMGHIFVRFSQGFKQFDKTAATAP